MVFSTAFSLSPDSAQSWRTRDASRRALDVGVRQHGGAMGGVPQAEAAP